MTTWHKGPPPSVGWWPASYFRNPDAHRYYNGEWWSAVAWPEYDAANAAAAVACFKDSFQDRIEWTDRPAWWPERSKT
jgi:hypothetical protein